MLWKENLRIRGVLGKIPIHQERWSLSQDLEGSILPSALWPWGKNAPGKGGSSPGRAGKGPSRVLVSLGRVSGGGSRVAVRVRTWTLQSSLSFLAFHLGETATIGGLWADGLHDLPGFVFCKSLCWTEGRLQGSKSRSREDQERGPCSNQE